jgi:urea transport system ATP-binding protein
VMLDGRPLVGPPWRRARRGVGRKFQVPRVFGSITARHNLQIADRGEPAGENEATLGDLAGVPAEQLSHGWRQWLETRMVTAQRPSLIVLDEPTAGIDPTERPRLAAEIRQLSGQATVLVVEHDLDFVGQIADRVSFLHEGRLVCTGSIDEVRADPTVRAAYLGGESL